MAYIFSLVSQTEVLHSKNIYILPNSQDYKYNKRDKLEHLPATYIFSIVSQTEILQSKIIYPDTNKLECLPVAYILDWSTSA